MIQLNAGIVTLNVYNYIYYIHYMVIIIVIKTNDVSIDVYYSNSEMT